MSEKKGDAILRKWGFVDLVDAFQGENEVNNHIVTVRCSAVSSSEPLA